LQKYICGYTVGPSGGEYPKNEGEVVGYMTVGNPLREGNFQ
jgi:hypothetical protein